MQDNNIRIYSTHDEVKSVVAERFIRILREKIYKYITSTSKNMYIDKWNGIVNKYNNAYQRTIKIKSVDVKSNTHFDFNLKNVD